MSILSKIIHQICTDLYSKVESVVDKVAVVTSDVAAVAEEVAAKLPDLTLPQVAAEAADKVADDAQALKERVATRTPKYGPMLEEILDAAQEQLIDEGGEKFDWHHSVEDTIKLVNTFSPAERQIDPSFSGRRQLAAEFGISDYKGTESDNIKLRDCFLEWLRSQ